MNSKKSADEEMRQCWGIDRDHFCKNCAFRRGEYCQRTTQSVKCTSYGMACAKYHKK